MSTSSAGSGGRESEDDIHYWVPRVRLMFAAEDPTVFSRRVAHAHMTRYKLQKNCKVTMLSDIPICTMS